MISLYSLQCTSRQQHVNLIFCTYMNKMVPRALEHAALASGDDDAREAGRAAAVQLRHAGHTPAGSMRHKMQIDE
jgi:hypothetical protein